MAKLLKGVWIFFLLQSTWKIRTIDSQQTVQLPEVLRRLSLPYHICTRTVDSVWACVLGSTGKDSGINSVETATMTPIKDQDNNFNEPTFSPDVEIPTNTEFSEFDTPSMTTDQQVTSTTTANIMPCSPVTSINVDAITEMEMQTGGDSSETSTDPLVTDNLIFEDDFNTFDLETWSHDVTMSGGGNWEFQIYVNNRSNSFVKNGMLHLRPTLTSSVYGEDFLSSGFLSLNGGSPADQCTNAWAGGCEKKGNATNILNPVMSAKIQTVYSFAFKYGRVEIRAKLPKGDFLWPAIRLSPFRYNYGRWPSSGEIHMVESRGNKELKNAEGENIGANQISSSLDFGPFFPLNGKDNAEFKTSSNIAFNEDFHIFELEWTPDFIRFSIDGNETGRVEPTDQGFWEIGKFDNVYDNPWEYSENVKMAPFDQKFYLTLNLAIGGTSGYFPDDSVGPYAKPWSDLSSTAFKEFWNSRSNWLPSWENSQNSSFIIDYVRVYSA